MTPEERFEAKVVRVPFSGCWLWVGASTNDQFDYGTFYLAGKFIRAHIAAWLLFRGSIPTGMCVLHSCDVAGCVNPAHLFLGTKRDNVVDMISKGRDRRIGRPGSKHHQTMLGEPDVMEIRRLYAEGKHSQSQLGKLYGVTQTAILKIVRRITWKHI